MGFSKSSAKGKVHSNTGLPQETRKSQINNLTLHLKQPEKEEMKNPRVSRRKEILKIRAEINAKETKETIAKINKTKSWFFERINKIDKPLARLIKKQREKNQMFDFFLIPSLKSMMGQCCFLDGQLGEISVT